jgi:hypothetical protein
MIKNESRAPIFFCTFCSWFNPLALGALCNAALAAHEFQNPPVFHQHPRFSPEHSTLFGKYFGRNELSTEVDILGHEGRVHYLNFVLLDYYALSKKNHMLNSFSFNFPTPALLNWPFCAPGVGKLNENWKSVYFMGFLSHCDTGYPCFFCFLSLSKPVAHIFIII